MTIHQNTMHDYKTIQATLYPKWGRGEKMDDPSHCPPKYAIPSTLTDVSISNNGLTA